MNIPFITVAQMREVDRLMIEKYRISLLQMMENAGFLLADLARERFLLADPGGKQVLVLAGSGGNGGGVLAAARRLHSWGAAVEVVLSRASHHLEPAPARQYASLQAVGISSPRPEEFRGLPDADLILDGLIGYGLRGNPRGFAARLIRLANQADVPVVSLDIPSGLDGTSGQPGDPCIHASATLTLALPKTGLRPPAARRAAGQLFLADIGVPPDLYRELGITVNPIFSHSPILPLRLQDEESPM
jgi:NAD(P)H-hydrate epimerase